MKYWWSEGGMHQPDGSLVGHQTEWAWVSEPYPYHTPQAVSHLLLQKHWDRAVLQMRPNPCSTPKSAPGHLVNSTRHCAAVSSQPLGLPITLSHPLRIASPHRAETISQWVPLIDLAWWHCSGWWGACFQQEIAPQTIILWHVVGLGWIEKAVCTMRLWWASWDSWSSFFVASIWA